MYTVPDADIEVAVAKRQKWAIVLALITLPCFPLGLLLPGIALFEAHRLTQQRGLTVRVEADGLRLSYGETVEHLKPTTVNASTVRDLLVLTGETEVGRKYWNLPLGADNGDAIVESFTAMGIPVTRSKPMRPAEGASIVVFVLLDRLLVTLAGFAALGTVFSIIGALLGKQSAVWIGVSLGGTFALLLVRAGMHQIGSANR